MCIQFENKILFIYVCPDKAIKLFVNEIYWRDFIAGIVTVEFVHIQIKWDGKKEKLLKGTYIFF